jgi:hypothetical protein
MTRHFGRLSLDRAPSDGVILIDGNESERSAISHALKSTTMASRISRR